MEPSYVKECPSKKEASEAPPKEIKMKGFTESRTSLWQKHCKEKWKKNQ